MPLSKCKKIKDIPLDLFCLLPKDLQERYKVLKDVFKKANDARDEAVAMKIDEEGLKHVCHEQWVAASEFSKFCKAAEYLFKP